MSKTDFLKSVGTLKLLTATAEREAGELMDGKKASCVRLRKSLQEIKNLSQLMRKDAMEYLKSIPTKPRKINVKIEEEKPEPEKPEKTKTTKTTKNAKKS